MSELCLICEHEQRDSIAADLRRNRPVREVCMTYHIPKLVLLKHLQHAPLPKPRAAPVQPPQKSVDLSPGEDGGGWGGVEDGGSSQERAGGGVNLSPAEAGGRAHVVMIPDFDISVAGDETLGTANFQDQQERAFRTAWRLMNPEKRQRNLAWLQEELLDGDYEA